jgi:hypothetical protein
LVEVAVEKNEWNFVFSDQTLWAFKVRLAAAELRCSQLNDFNKNDEEERQASHFQDRNSSRKSDKAQSRFPCFPVAHQILGWRR